MRTLLTLATVSTLLLACSAPASAPTGAPAGSAAPVAVSPTPARMSETESKALEAIRTSGFVKLQANQHGARFSIRQNIGLKVVRPELPEGTEAWVVRFDPAVLTPAFMCGTAKDGCRLAASEKDALFYAGSAGETKLEICVAGAGTACAKSLYEVTVGVGQ